MQITYGITTPSLETTDPGLGAGQWQLGVFQAVGGQVLNVAGYMQIKELVSGNTYKIATFN